MVMDIHRLGRYGPSCVSQKARSISPQPTQQDEAIAIRSDQNAPEDLRSGRSRGCYPA